MNNVMSFTARAPATHPVVYAWRLHSLERSTAPQFQTAALTLVARMAKLVGQGVTKERGLRLASHAKAICARAVMLQSNEEQQARECHQMQIFSVTGRSLKGPRTYIRGRCMGTRRHVNLSLLSLCYVSAAVAWSTEHASTLDTVNNLGDPYYGQGKMAEAEEMLLRALRGYEKLSWVPPARVESVKQSLSSLRQRPTRFHNEQAMESIPHVDDGCATPPEPSAKRGSRESPAALSKLMRKMWKRS
jgi:hypothetical protein